MQIGRVGQGTLTLLEPDMWEEGPDGSVSTGGLLRDLTFAELRFQRLQLLGLLSPDESEVPVLLGSTDDDRNGWYRVQNVTVGNILGRSETHGDRRWSMSLRRVVIGNARRVELVRFGSVIANSKSQTESGTRAVVVLPATAAGVDLGTGAATYTRSTRATTEGDVAVYDEGTGASLFRTTAAAVLPLADAYVGACRVEVQVDSTWRTLVGREVDPSANWRLSNGLLRVSWLAANSSLHLELWTGSAWTALAAERMQVNLQEALSVPGAPRHFEVLQNSPNQAVVRLVVGGTAANDRHELDLRIRRGHRAVACSLFGRAAAKRGIAVMRAGSGGIAYTAQASDRGIARTDADANGLKWVINAPAAYTLPIPAEDVGPSYALIQLATAGTRFNFGVGLVATSGTGPVTTTSNEYFAQPDEYQVVAR
jgi:hypothetical protein